MIKDGFDAIKLACRKALNSLDAYRVFRIDQPDRRFYIVTPKRYGKPVCFKNCDILEVFDTDEINRKRASCSI